MTKSTQRSSSTNAMSTDSILIRALQSRKLTAADQLFSVSDYDIITEIHPALVRIKQLLNEPNYVDNQNDQQIVELVLSRITVAIRETNTIEIYCPALLDLFETCLNHWMTIVHGNQIQDSAYCKIVLEILSALFLNHNKTSVMTLAVPATFILFERTDSESLINTAASYLSLSALNNGKILAQYSIQLIKNILKGHHSLIALLPNLYPYNAHPFNLHIVPLLKLLYSPTTKISEKLSLLQFILMVSNESPDLIISHLSEFDDFLLNQSTCAATLQIFLSLVNNNRVGCLTGQMIPIRRAAEKADCSQYNLLTMVKIIASIAKHNDQMRIIAVNDIINICHKLSSQPLSNALKEIEAIAELFPHVVQPKIGTIQKIAEKHPTTFSIFMRIKSITSEVAAHDLQNQNAVNYMDSVESLTSKRSSRAFPSDPAPFKELNEQNQTLGELDRNMENLAYRMRSTGSLGQPRTRSFLSLTAPPTNRMAYNDEEMCKNCSKGNQTTPRTSSKTESNPTNRHSLVASGNSFIRPQLPIPFEKTPLPPPVPTQIQLGRDGRVRPIMQHRLRNPNWIAETADSSNTITTTTFPVFAAKRNTLSGSQVRMVDEHSAKSRQQSVDTLVGRTSRSNSEQVPNTSGEVPKDDVVRQFVEHRRSKIRRYVYDFNAHYPIPVKCTIEGSKNTKSKMKIHFACQSNSMQHCMYNRVDDLFAFKTKMPEVWLHVMFLHVQTAHMHLSGGHVLDQNSNEFITLANCWNFLPTNVTKSKKFSNLVVSQFPNQKEKSRILKELQEARFFDSFTFDLREHKWLCSACLNPERVLNMIQNGDHRVLLEGQLKQKKPRFWFLNRWNNKYFRLSTSSLTCGPSTFNAHTYNGRSRQQNAAPIDLHSVRSLSRGRKNRKSLASTFEIQTDNDTYVLKANNSSKAEEWFQFLQIAVAQAKQQKQQRLQLTN